MRRRRPRISILVCALALALALAGCGGGEQGAEGDGLEKSSITVGVLPVVDFVALWVAQDRGLFTKHGLKVRFEVQSGGATAVPKLAAGSLDFSIVNYVSAIQATQTGTVPLRIPLMWGVIILLGALGYLLNTAFLALENRALHWHTSERT